jgi:hypothetical protein
MLPTPSFGQAIQRVPERGKEAAAMGDYYPASKYYADKSAVEKLGCHLAAAPGTFIQPPARHCASRRNFRIRLLRNRPRVRLRSARVYVNGRRVKTLRGRRITAPVSLRGLPKGRFTVRIVAITRGGKRLVSLRRYRTCTPRRRA